MILILLIQIKCEITVFTGFSNETLILWPLKVNITNSNIQNFVDNEYKAMDYYVKENLLQYKVRENNGNQFSFYDIWLLSRKGDNYKILKITPFLNYKSELIYEFTNKRVLCLNIYLFQQKFILDCTNYKEFQINLIEVDLSTNESNISNITFNYDLRSQREIYFSKDRLIFLFKEIDNNIISVYNQTISQEIYQFNKTNFQLLNLNIKRIIIQSSHIIALTKCQRLYKFNLDQNEQPQQICENLQIYDIQENFGTEVYIFTKYHLYILNYLNTCIEKFLTQQYQVPMYQIFQIDEIEIHSYKYNFQFDSLSPLQICNPLGQEEFMFYKQMLLCKQMHSLYHVILPTIQFQQILISNNFYKIEDKLVIIRSMEPGEIQYIETDEEFFPILNLQTENFEIMHRKLFHGPNITYTFKAQDIQVEFSQFTLQNIYDPKLCIYQKLILFSEKTNFFSQICQFENNTVIINQHLIQQQIDKIVFSNDFQYIYHLDIKLSENIKILNANYLQLELLNLNTKEITCFIQQNPISMQQSLYYKYNLKLKCYLQSDFVYCSKGYQSEKNIFYLINIQRVGIYEQVKFIYLPINSYFLFLVTGKYVIIIHLLMLGDSVQQYQLVQLVQTKGEVKQLYFNQKVLFIVYSNQGYLSISKYFEISPQYFKYLGEVDCLGYKLGNLEQNNNGSEDYYFINSNENVIIFQLQGSLQDSFLSVITNAEFIISRQHQFCIQQNNLVKCYSMIQNQSKFQLNLDKINYTQAIPYEICARNSKNTKCFKQNLKILVGMPKLMIDGYQLTQINSDVYQIDIKILQGKINDFSIIDGNAILSKNLQQILVQNNTLQQFIELQDQILMNIQGQSVIIYDKRHQTYKTIDIINCKVIFWMKTHLLCQESLTFVSIYICDDYWNCTYRNRAQLEGLTVALKSSGYFLLQKQNTKLAILQYRPKTYDFNHVFVDNNQSQFEQIQSINDNDFWLIRVKGRYIQIYKFTNLQLQMVRTINYTERFNLDNQYVERNDFIQAVITLQYDQNSINVLFLMVLSSHKTYQISLINDQMDFSCLFILMWSVSDFYQIAQQLIVFQNNDLLFVLMKQNYIGVYNVSQHYNFYRNIIFSFKLSSNFNQDISIRKFYHFSHNNKNFIFAQAIQQLYLYQVDLNYKLKMLNNKQHTLINLNRMNENIIIKIEIPNQLESFSYQYFVILLLIILYIYIRFELIKRTK